MYLRPIFDLFFPPTLRNLPLTYFLPILVFRGFGLLGGLSLPSTKVIKPIIGISLHVHWRNLRHEGGAAIG